MRRFGVFAEAVSVAASLLVSSCSDLGTLVQPRPFALSRAHVDEAFSRYDAAHDRFLPWAEDVSDIIVIDKVTRELVLYRHGRAVKEYPVVLGRIPGRKRFEGDHRTPSGLYKITDKHPSAKYDRFMAISYPNDEDRERYEAALTGGLIPAALRRGPQASLGGLVGIHGSDKEDFNKLGINWTFGCISLANRDVEELYGEVSEGTPVLIRDDQQP
jgi:murein L,D-transpeptidase YafK